MRLAGCLSGDAPIRPADLDARRAGFLAFQSESSPMADPNNSSAPPSGPLQNSIAVTDVR